MLRTLRGGWFGGICSKSWPVGAKGIGQTLVCRSSDPCVEFCARDILRSMSTGGLLESGEAPHAGCKEIHIVVGRSAKRVDRLSNSLDVFTDQ